MVGGYKSLQPSHQGQPQRPPQRRPTQSGRPASPGPYKRRRRKSKKPIIIGAAIVLMLILTVVISVCVHNANEHKRTLAQIKSNADAVTPFSEQLEAASHESNANSIADRLANTTWSNDDMRLQFYDTGKVGLYLAKDGSISVWDWVVENGKLTLFSSDNPDIEAMTYSVGVTDQLLVWGPFILQR